MLAQTRRIAASGDENAVCGEERCVTTLKTAAKETNQSVIVIKPKMKFTFFYCSKYATIRDHFYKKIEPFILNVSWLPVTVLILLN